MNAISSPTTSDARPPSTFEDAMFATEREAALARELGSAIVALDNARSEHTHAMRAVRAELATTRAALALERETNEFLTTRLTAMLELVAELEQEAPATPADGEALS